MIKRTGVKPQDKVVEKGFRRLEQTLEEVENQQYSPQKDVIPANDVNLGSDKKRFKKIYVEDLDAFSETVKIGDIKLSQDGKGADSSLKVSGSGNSLKIGDLTLKQSGTGDSATLKIDNTSATSDNNAISVKADKIDPGTSDVTLRSTSGTITIEQTGPGGGGDARDIDLKVPTDKKIEFFVNGTGVGSVDSEGFKNANGDVLGPGGSEITLTDTAPTSSSDFASTDIILEKDTGKLWWYSATNSKLYSHTYDGQVDLNFNITSFNSNDLPANTTYFIKDEGQTLDSTVDFQCTVNNPSGNSISSGTVTLSGKTNSSQTLSVSSTTLSGGSSPFSWDTNDISVLYPDNADSWSDGSKAITFSLSMNDGSSTDTSSFSIYFKNKKFYGYTTATDPTAGSFNIYDLQSSAYVTTSYTQSSVTINTSASDNYVYYAYPARISGTPTFKINGFNTAFTSSTVTKTNQASNGYSESYIIWKSPQVYNDATLTLEVT